MNKHVLSIKTNVINAGIVVGLFLLLFGLTAHAGESCGSAACAEGAKTGAAAGAVAKKEAVKAPVSKKESAKTVAAEAVLKKEFPQIKIDKFEYDDTLKMYRVTINNRFMFLTPDMKYAFIGDVINVKTKQSILYAPPKPIAKTDFSKLPMGDVIKMGKGATKIALFMSITCPHCHTQFKDLEANKDITTYIYLYPGADMIWCAPDKYQALSDIINEKKTDNKTFEKCDTSGMDRNHKLGKSMGIHSTPTMIFEDGSNNVGYLPPAAFKEQLSTKGKK